MRVPSCKSTIRLLEFRKGFYEGSFLNGTTRGSIRISGSIISFPVLLTVFYKGTRAS